MKPALSYRLLVAACISAFIGLALMVWSVLDPRPVPVVVSMTVGQAFGTLSLLLYLIVVFMDIKRRHQ
jgi:hypothetical protein